jgi:succinate dehydrogenase / fumarate reductase flavoprotein subunit
MYQKITDSDPTKEPMMIYPAVHYTMGGLWVDYHLMTTVPGLYATGECNFSDHGANRLGASALMQGLADGYFVIPYTIGNYLATVPPVPTNTNDPAFDVAVNAVKDQTAKLLKNTKSGKGGQTVDHFHKELGKIMWDHCGMARNKEGLELALKRIPEIRAEFWENVIVPGSGQELNQSLERAGRVADFLEFGELLARDALNREESCGGHFREESQTEENEAKRDDVNFSYAAVWEYKGQGNTPALHKEPLIFENVTPSQRSYK